MTNGDVHSRFPVPAIESLPDDMQATIADVKEKTGFVPNVFRSLAHRPKEWRAFFEYLSILMDAEDGLPVADREMIAVAASAVNHCLYCVVSHSALVRLRSKDPILADQVAIDWRKADLTPGQYAMLAFAEKFAATPSLVVEADYAELRERGFSEDDIWEIGAITSFFAMSNRLSHLMATPPNPEFHLLGRVPVDVYRDITSR